MTERVVILDPAKPLQFLDEACSALADAVSDTSDADAAHEELAAVYAEVVGAYGRLLREELGRLPEISKAWLDIVDHLLMRLAEARGRELSMSVLEIATSFAVGLRTSPRSWCSPAQTDTTLDQASIHKCT